MIWLSLHLWGSTSRGKHPGKWGTVWVRGEEKRNKYVVAAQCQHQGETSQEFCLYQTHYGADLTRICQQKCGCCRLSLVQHQSTQHLLLQILFWDIHSYKVCSCHSTTLHKRKQSNWNARCTGHIHWEEMTRKSFRQYEVCTDRHETREKELVVRQGLLSDEEPKNTGWTTGIQK